MYPIQLEIIDMTESNYFAFYMDFLVFIVRLVWLVVLRINVDLAIFQPYLDLEAGDFIVRNVQLYTSLNDTRNDFYLKRYFCLL